MWHKNMALGYSPSIDWPASREELDWWYLRRGECSRVFETKAGSPSAPWEYQHRRYRGQWTRHRLGEWQGDKNSLIAALKKQKPKPVSPYKKYHPSFQAVGDRGAWVWAFAQQPTLSPGLQLRAVTNQCFLYPEKFEATAQLHTKLKRSQAQVYVCSWGVHQVRCQLLFFYQPGWSSCTKVVVVVFFFGGDS